MKDINKRFGIYSFVNGKYNLIAEFSIKENALCFVSKLDKNPSTKNTFYVIKNKK